MTAAGRSATDPSEVASALQSKLIEEFGGNGGVVSEQALAHTIAAGRAEAATAVAGSRPAAPTLGLPQGRRAWAHALLDAFGSLLGRRASGGDGVPAELAKAGGMGYAEAVADVVAKIPAEGAPVAWRGGRMAGVPRKAGPMSWKNMRGVLCSQIAAKDYAKVLRVSCSQWLPLFAGADQHGAIKGSSTAEPAHLIKA